MYTQASDQEKFKSIKATTHEGTDWIEAAVRHEAKEIRDKLGEMKQSIETLASSSAASQLSSGKFFFFYNGGAVDFPFRLWREICACFYFKQKLISLL